ncbi:hypothetical protein GCM10023223_45290 [Stackebrandtia albiflava]
MTTSLTGWILRRPDTPQPGRIGRVIAILVVTTVVMVAIGLVAATLAGDRLAQWFGL